MCVRACVHVCVRAQLHHLILGTDQNNVCRYLFKHSHCLNAYYVQMNTMTPIIVLLIHLQYGPACQHKTLNNTKFPSLVAYASVHRPSSWKKKGLRTETFHGWIKLLQYYIYLFHRILVYLVYHTTLWTHSTQNTISNLGVSIVELLCSCLSLDNWVHGYGQIRKKTLKNATY